jgi:low temperature requirement protein LtrA
VAIVRPVSGLSLSGRLARFTRVEPTSSGHTVTPLELFFDLVYVFAITQVTALMAHELGWRGAVRGLVVLALLWWAWCSYAWLGNQARADEGLVRTGMIIATAALLLVALAIPEAWADHGEHHLNAALLLAVALGVVRMGHLTVYWIAAAGDTGLRRQLVRTAVPVIIAIVLLVAGSLVGGAWQTGLWLLALAVDYSGIYLAGTDWRLPAPGHFAERHGLIVLIALGESLVAIGVGINDQPLTVPLVGMALLGLAISVALWWAYFDVVASVAEGVLHRQTGIDRIKLARDSYTYLHFPMVAGIVFLALGLKKVAEYVADTSHHELTDALPPTARWALFGGIAAYLVAHLAFRYRNTGSLNPARAVAAVLLVVVGVVGYAFPALAQLGIAAAITVAMIAYEVIRYADARIAIRHRPEP